MAQEVFAYDAAGNVTSAPDSSFQYDTNNRLISWGGNTVSYDLDGNMLSNASLTCTYDSANRLVSAGAHTYTYNAEDVRIRNLCADEDTTYTYSTNAKLSKLLCKTTGGVTTKYVYGRGLIGEEVNNTFKTYHFDCRGSTIAITDASGNITDTFAYDTYGKLLTRTGTSEIIFGYNGRYGVVTDDNGLIYMRERYYSPAMKRFINADVIAGAISNAITLNRFAFANGNPVSFVDPFGLSPFDGIINWFGNKANDIKDWAVDTYNEAKDAIVDTYNEVKDWVVDTYNDAKQAIVETYNEVKDWTVDTYNDVKERVNNNYDNVNNTKTIIKELRKKAGNAFINSIEMEAGIGYGFGKSIKVGGLKVEAEAYSDNFTVRVDDNEIFMDNSGSVGISAGVSGQKRMSVGFGSSYHHDYVDRPNDCKEHNAWSNPFDIATCEYADKTPITVTIPIKGSIINGEVSKEDTVVGISGSKHVGIGYHYSIGFNVTQFLKELLE